MTNAELKFYEGIPALFRDLLEELEDIAGAIDTLSDTVEKLTEKIVEQNTLISGQ